MVFEFYHDPIRDHYAVVSGKSAWVSFVPQEIEPVDLESPKAQDAIDYSFIPVSWNQIPPDFREGFKDHFDFDDDGFF